jgi:hypothetical protein
VYCIDSGEARMAIDFMRIKDSRHENRRNPREKRPTL